MTKRVMPPAQPITIPRIERALLLLAYFIELDGDVYLPLYEKCEAELALLQRQPAVRERARKRLADAGGVRGLEKNLDRWRTQDHTGAS